MNMLAHHHFAVSDDDGPATATIELDVPMYVGSALFCEFPAKVFFIRDETERDGFHIEEMVVVDLRTGYPGKVVRQYNSGGPLEHDMACAIIKEFGTDAALRSAEEAMKRAEHEDNQPGPFGLRPVRGERA